MKKLFLYTLVAGALCCVQALALKPTSTVPNDTRGMISGTEVNTTEATQTTDDSEMFDTLIVSVTTPGAMGDSILAKVENFSDVKGIKITGTLNDDDLTTLKNRLSNLVYLDMSEVNMTELPDEFFRGKSGLKKVILPKILTSIGNTSFYYCTGLTEIDFPSTLKSIGNSAFYHCQNIRKVILPEGLTSLGEQAFNYCTGNTILKVPSSLKTISYFAFGENDSLKVVDFAEGLTRIDYGAFYGCNSLESIMFPNSLYSIGDRAFSDSKKLKDIDFNEGLYMIEDDAFSYCDSLKEITLPSSLVIAKYDPFSYCKNLIKVTCHSIEPPFLGTASSSRLLYGCDMTGRELYVPALSINTYKQTSGWDHFPTTKPIDYLPENITIIDDLHLTLPETRPTDYKANVALTNDEEISSKYGTLTVNGDGTLSMSKFSTYWNRYNYWEDESNVYYCSLINNSHLRADSVEINVKNYCNTWSFLSFPFNVKVSDIVTTASGRTNFIIRKYDGQARANGVTDSTWVKMTVDSTLHAGVGYILQSSRYADNSSQSYSTFTFKAINDVNKNDLFISTDASVPLAEYQSEYAHNRSWNLIGNPYPCYYDTRYMDFTAPITVWNAYYKTYYAYSPVDDSYILRPGEAFFVQRPVDVKSITFKKEGRQTDRTAAVIEKSENTQTRAAFAPARTIINLTLTDGELTDKTRIVLNDDDAQMGYEMDKDASKFISTNALVPQIFTTADGVDYAINERPTEDGLVKVSVRINKDDMCTIALANDVDGYTITLEDKETSKMVTISENTPYVFTSTTTGTSSRFVLHIRKASTGVDSIANDNGDAQSTYFTIDGKQTSKPTSKGLYIKNNQKVIIK